MILQGEKLIPADGRRENLTVDSLPNLRVLPARLHVDVPWSEPWDELEEFAFQLSESLPSGNLPPHLDQCLASVSGSVGESHRVLKIDCEAKLREPYFRQPVIKYVSVEVDIRGDGSRLIANAHKLPFQDDSFDFCTSVAIYEHSSCH